MSRWRCRALKSCIKPLPESRGVTERSGVVEMVLGVRHVACASEDEHLYAMMCP